MNSRRNGKPASCEPCRLNKTKCDHAVPVCERCIQRGIANKCFYHPAPLTKPRPVSEQRQSQIDGFISRPAKRQRVSAQKLDTFVMEDGEFPDAVTVRTYRPGYLGPTSYEAALPKDESSPILRNREASVESQVDVELAHQHPITRPMRMQMTADILKTFRYFSTIKELIIWFGLQCEAGTIPMPLDVELLNMLESIIDQYDLRHSIPDPRLVNMVLENSSKQLEISKDLQACDFHKICSGENLRLETIGFLLATAGRALSFGTCPHLINEQTNPGLRSKLVDELLRASTSCIILCSLISPVNDLLTWAIFGSYQLTVMVCGFSGPPSWRIMGELTTQIYALGIHRESSASNLPSWLRETRRRLFCSSYMQEKTIATFLGRPTRMSKRHTDIRMARDLSDEEVVGDEQTFDTAASMLDENGWNRGKRYLRASWLRIRYISSQLLEEILDFALVKIDATVEAKLLDISSRIHSTWNNIPVHLRYWPTCWDQSLPTSVCLMLVVVYQTHYYNEFIIRKLLSQKQPLTSNFELLRVSMTLLSNALTLGRLRDRSYDIHKDFLTELILFGIPSASVLASALQEQQRTAQHFPRGISRAEIIRMLSVLISHLETAAHLDSSSARPGEANYELCRKARRAFTRVMDNVLDPPPLVGIEGQDAVPVGGGEDGLVVGREDEIGGADLDMFAAPGLEAFEGMEFGGTGGMGMAGGLSADDGIDWGMMAQWNL